MVGNPGWETQREDGKGGLPPRDASSSRGEGLREGLVREDTKTAPEPHAPGLRCGQKGHVRVDGSITLIGEVEFHAIVHEEDGSLWAEVEELPGCFASGKDLNELTEAVIEAISMCMTPKDTRKLLAVEQERAAMRVGAITVATAPLVPA